MIWVKIIWMRVCHGSELGRYGWTWVEFNWVRGLSDLGRLGLDRLVSGLGEFGLEWNKVKSAQIDFRINLVEINRLSNNLGRKKSAFGMTCASEEISFQNDLGRKKSTSGMTWVGRNRYRNDLGRKKSAFGIKHIFFRL